MEIAIIGLPKSGKTTVFNALIKGHAEIGVYASSNEPNVGVVKVPDERLEVLKGIFKPKKWVPAEIKYLDLPGKGFSKGEGFSGSFLTYVSRVDALLHVVRAFEDNRVPHISGSVNPKRDVEEMELELVFSDLGIVEKRLQRLEASLRAARHEEREPLLREQSVLAGVKRRLEANVPIRAQGLSVEEQKAIGNFQFLTAKPVLVLLNLDEAQMADSASLEREIGQLYQGPNSWVVRLCGKLEAELADLDEVEAREFRSTLAVPESGTERVIKASYQLLGLIYFFTFASSEVRAWAIPSGTIALKAAGKIHSDMEKGFIRAEVVGYDDLVKSGNLTEARKHGLLRLEGRNYVVRDGDVITFLFNV